MNALDAAHRLFAANRAAVVLVRDGRICAQGNGRGLAPLLDLCDRQPSDVAGAWVVDRVVGRAAAAVCIAFGAARVHADLMCEPARALLAAHGGRSTSTFSNAASKSRLISVRTFCARP